MEFQTTETIPRPNDSLAPQNLSHFSSNQPMAESLNHPSRFSKSPLRRSHQKQRYSLEENKSVSFANKIHVREFLKRSQAKKERDSFMTVKTNDSSNMMQTSKFGQDDRTRCRDSYAHSTNLSPLRQSSPPSHYSSAHPYRPELRSDNSLRRKQSPVDSRARRIEVEQELEDFDRRENLVPPLKETST
jgi:hypothetical protein